MDLAQEVERIKKELVDLIILHLKENKIDIDKSRKLAKDFLAVLPIKDQKDLLLKLKNLSEEYAEAREIYVKELGKLNEEKRNTALTQMRNAIKEGNLDDAISVAKAMKEE